MESSLKRRRAQDDLGKLPRKFSKCKPFQNDHQPHLPLFIIHRSSSFHDDLVDGLPTVADELCLGTAGLLSPTADKENIDPISLNRYHNIDARCPRRKPLQDQADINGSVNNEDSIENTNLECWVTRDGELYTAVTGPLARSFGDERKMLERLQFEEEDFTDSGILKATSFDSETPTLASTPPREAGPAGVVSRPPPGQIKCSTGDEKALGLIQKLINTWADNGRAFRCREASAF